MVTTYIPSADRMPALGSLPDTMWAAMSGLSKMETVQDVVAMRSEKQITFYVTFNGGPLPEYRKAISCFRGLKPAGFRLEGSNYFMQLSIRT